MKKNLTCERGSSVMFSITASVRGWVNHVRYGNTVGLRKAVLGKLVMKTGRQIKPLTETERAGTRPRRVEPVS